VPRHGCCDVVAEPDQLALDPPVAPIGSSVARRCANSRDLVVGTHVDRVWPPCEPPATMCIVVGARVRQTSTSPHEAPRQRPRTDWRRASARASTRPFDRVRDLMPRTGRPRVDETWWCVLPADADPSWPDRGRDRDWRWSSCLRVFPVAATSASVRVFDHLDLRGRRTCPWCEGRDRREAACGFCTSVSRASMSTRKRSGSRSGCQTISRGRGGWRSASTRRITAC
jgi:hypothetical protein